MSILAMMWATVVCAQTATQNYVLSQTMLDDHQGNNRLVMSEDGVVEQVNDYTPFGVQMRNSFAETSDQRYKYNGNELDCMLGLDLYDYGARFYDARIARWQTIDPLCEKYYSTSPYAYCANNPLNLVDRDGRDYTVTVTNDSIVFSATFYTREINLESANLSAEIIMGQNNDFTFDLSNSRSLPIIFDITIKQIEFQSSSGEDRDLSDYTQTRQDNPTSNIYDVSDYKLEENVNGRTIGGYYVKVRNSRATTDTGAHEMGHALGFEHDSTGLMTAGSNDPKRDGDKLTPKNIKNSIINSLKNSPNSSLINHSRYSIDEIRKGRVKVKQHK